MRNLHLMQPLNNNPFSTNYTFGEMLNNVSHHQQQIKQTKFDITHSLKYTNHDQTIMSCTKYGKGFGKNELLTYEETPKYERNESNLPDAEKGISSTPIIVPNISNCIKVSLTTTNSYIKPHFLPTIPNIQISHKQVIKVNPSMNHIQGKEMKVEEVERKKIVQNKRAISTEPKFFQTQTNFNKIIHKISDSPRPVLQREVAQSNHILQPTILKKPFNLNTNSRNHSLGPALFLSKREIRNPQCTESPIDSSENKREWNKLWASTAVIRARRWIKMYFEGRKIKGKRLIVDTKEDKKILIIDIDQTLITNHLIQNNIHQRSPRGETIFQEGLCYIKRPYVDCFLSKMSKLYTIYVFTAADPIYARNVLKGLDPSRKLIKGLLTRENISFIIYQSNFLPLKTSTLLFPLNPKNFVILDDSAQVWINDLSNLIPIPPFKGLAKDNALIRASHLLEYIAWSKDPRPILKEQFDLQRLFHIEYLLVKDLKN